LYDVTCNLSHMKSRGIKSETDGTELEIKVLSFVLFSNHVSEMVRLVQSVSLDRVLASFLANY